MIDERLSSSVLINDFRAPDGGQTCTLAHHLSLRSLMVRASYRSSEGCRFDCRQGLRNRFFEEQSLTNVHLIQSISKLPQFKLYISSNTLFTYSGFRSGRTRISRIFQRSSEIGSRQNKPHRKQIRQCLLH